MGEGRPTKTAQICAVSQDEAADHVEGMPIGTASELLNVAERTTKRARKVKDEGAADLVSAVKAGEIAVSDAAAIVNEDEATHARGTCVFLHPPPRTTSS